MKLCMDRRQPRTVEDVDFPLEYKFSYCRRRRWRLVILVPLEGSKMCRPASDNCEATLASILLLSE